MAPLTTPNYPQGFANGVTIRGMPLMQVQPGKVFWVSNATTLVTGQRGGSDGNRGTFESPFATLNYAITQCTASRGDIIMVKPGHAESITSNTALLFNIAGVAIVGLGLGSLRPTFTLTTANTNRIPVSAANMSIQNCIFIGNFLSIATCFLLTTAAEFTIDNCEFRDTDATHGFLSIVTTTVAVNCDGFTFSNNTVKSDATTTPGPTIVVANTMSRLKIIGNFVTHTVATNNIAALLEHGALVMTQALIAWNYVYSINTDTASGAVLVKTTATTGSGMIMHNRVRTQDPDSAIQVTLAAVQYGMFDNLYTGEVTQLQGFLLPVAGSDA